MMGEEKMTQKTTSKKKVALALQGGGAHGAFTWGVLDKLLEDGRFEIEGLSGTSAGGMNAVAVAQGIAEGGNEGGRAKLTEFWTKISESSRHSSLKPGPLDKAAGKYTMNNTPAFMAFEFMTRMLSPYEFNPFDMNPLRDVVKEIFDFELLNKLIEPKVFLAATHVYSGKVKSFDNATMKPESVLASACLPFLHHAVMVDGEYYWDGGFIGNPILYPLIENCPTSDIILVRINPINRKTLPTHARDIMDRLNEITSNAGMMREMRAVAFITKLIDEGKVKEGALKRLFMHDISCEDAFQDLGFSSKLNADWEFLNHLKEIGQKTAADWIAKNFENIGKKSTENIYDEFM
jgi:NTE family protein